MIDLHDYFELDEDFIVRWKRARGNNKAGTEVGNNVTLGGNRFQRSALFLILASTNTKSNIADRANTKSDIADRANTKSNIADRANTKSDIADRANTKSDIADRTTADLAVSDRANTKSDIADRANTKSDIADRANTKSDIALSNTKLLLEDEITNHQLTLAKLVRAEEVNADLKQEYAEPFEKHCAKTNSHNANVVGLIASTADYFIEKEKMPRTLSRNPLLRLLEQYQVVVDNLNR